MKINYHIKLLLLSTILACPALYAADATVPALDFADQYARKAAQGLLDIQKDAHAVNVAVSVATTASKNDAQRCIKALQTARTNNNQKLIESLLSRASDYMFKAVDHDDVETLAMLHKAGISLDITNTGKTLLTRAACKGSLQAAEWLVRNDPRKETIERLVNELDEISYSPLLSAVMNVDNEAVLATVKWLLAQGAHPNVQAKNGMVPLLAAATGGPLEKMLIAAGASVNFRDHDSGDTPLIFAARQGKDIVVRTLLNKNADISAKNNSAQTALAAAQGAGHHNVVRILQGDPQSTGLTVNGQLTDEQMQEMIAKFNSRFPTFRALPHFVQRDMIQNYYTLYVRYGANEGAIVEHMQEYYERQPKNMLLVQQAQPVNTTVSTKNDPQLTPAQAAIIATKMGEGVPMFRGMSSFAQLKAAKDFFTGYVVDQKHQNNVVPGRKRVTMFFGAESSVGPKTVKSSAIPMAPVRADGTVDTTLQGVKDWLLQEQPVFGTFDARLQHEIATVLHTIRKVPHVFKRCQDCVDKVIEFAQDSTKTVQEKIDGLLPLYAWAGCLQEITARVTPQNVNARFSDGNTPLLASVNSPIPEKTAPIVHLLLERNANVTLENVRGNTALKGATDLYKATQDACCADPRDGVAKERAQKAQNMHTMITRAVTQQNMNCVPSDVYSDKKIIDNMIKFVGYATSGDLAHMQELYSKESIDINASFNGDTAIHRAAIGGHAHIIEWLLAQPYINPFKLNRLHKTPYDVARGPARFLLASLCDARQKELRDKKEAQEAQRALRAQQKLDAQKKIKDQEDARIAQGLRQKKREDARAEANRKNKEAKKAQAQAAAAAQEAANASSAAQAADLAAQQERDRIQAEQKRNEQLKKEKQRLEKLLEQQLNTQAKTLVQQTLKQAQQEVIEEAEQAAQKRQAGIHEHKKQLFKTAVERYIRTPIAVADYIPDDTVLEQELRQLGDNIYNKLALTNHVQLFVDRARTHNLCQSAQSDTPESNEILKKWLELVGGNPNAHLLNGQSALEIAITHGCRQAQNILKAAGANVEDALRAINYRQDRQRLVAGYQRALTTFEQELNHAPRSARSRRVPSRKLPHRLPTLHENDHKHNQEPRRP